MLNNENFISRLEIIMEKNQLSAAAFAERIGVQRSSVSHILSKRNKPSLDFILKINNSFNEVTLDWLLLEESSKKIKPLADLDEIGEHTKNDSNDESVVKPNNNENFDSSNEVTEVIKFYKDGSFKNFFPRT
tara:strand:- start:221 stop:616 length:396 start_codon:yes stop_codon:yes gene_type:complete